MYRCLLTKRDFSWWQIGKGVVRREGTDVALLGYGTMVNDCLAAAEVLAQQKISATVMDMRFCKPLDTDLVKQAVKNHAVVITVEENSIGGFGSHGKCVPFLKQLHGTP
jgi:1-deoxy-D-xylulose-5-phosphate synthase